MQEESESPSYKTDDVKTKEETSKEKKKYHKSDLTNLISFEKLGISEMDRIFDDIKKTLDPFVTNRRQMEKAEEAFKDAVRSWVDIKPEAAFHEYVHNLKTKLAKKNIFVKIKEGAIVVVGEVELIADEIKKVKEAIEAMISTMKGLKDMLPSIFKASKDGIERAASLDIEGITERQFKSLSDASKIPNLKKKFTGNMKNLKQAPSMVREFYNEARKIVLEIYDAFADDEEKENMKTDLPEEKDKETEGSQDDQDDGNKEKPDKFHKKLIMKIIDIPDIDNTFQDFAKAVNPFIVTREKIETARQSFQTIVQALRNFEPKKDLKEYIDELKKKAEEDKIRIYFDKDNGVITAVSTTGIEPPKLYRDAVKALTDMKKACQELVDLEPHVQQGIRKTIDDVSEISPVRDIKKHVKIRELHRLPGKIIKFKNNLKNVKQTPSIINEFVNYVKQLVLDITYALKDDDSNT